MNKTNIIDIDIDKKIFEFYNKHLNVDNVDIVHEKIKKIVGFAIEKEEIKVDKINVTIKSASKYIIKKLNFEYRDIDKVTDVLSFPMFSQEELNDFKGSIKSDKVKEIELGDIVLCLDTILKQSKEYNTGIERELLYMITHGMCHLLGYDHMNEDEKKEMRELEEEILGSVGVYKIV